MNITLTGASGFLGNRLIARLCEQSTHETRQTGGARDETSHPEAEMMRLLGVEAEEQRAEETVEHDGFGSTPKSVPV